MDKLHDCYYSETAFRRTGSAMYRTPIGVIHVTEIIECGKKPVSCFEDLVKLPWTVKYSDFVRRDDSRALYPINLQFVPFSY